MPERRVSRLGGHHTQYWRTLGRYGPFSTSAIRSTPYSGLQLFSPLQPHRLTESLECGKPEPITASAQEAVEAGCKAEIDNVSLPNGS